MTLSQVIVQLKTLCENLKLFIRKENLTPFLKEMCKAIWSEITTRFDKDKHVERCFIPMLLDPRLKDEHVIRRLFWNDNQEELFKAAVKDLRVDLRITLSMILPDSELDHSQPQPEASSEPSPDELAFKPFKPSDIVLAAATANPRKPSRNRQGSQNRWIRVQQKVEEERQRFLAAPLLKYEKDPLAWWKQNAILFPGHALVARSYLAEPASSVPSERVFSRAGRLLIKSRGSLTENKFNMLLFLNLNQETIRQLRQQLPLEDD